MAIWEHAALAPRRVLSAVTLFTTFFVCSTSLASSDAITFLKRRQAQLTVALANKDYVSVDRIFDRMLDYDTIAHDSLGAHWEKLNTKQRAEFRCVLRGLVSQAYRRDLEKTLDYSVTFGQTHRQANGVLVETIVKHRTNRREQPIRISYLVHDTGAALEVRDIITEGSSLVNNYRHQFSRIIRDQGYKELIRRMKQKLGETANSC